MVAGPLREVAAHGSHTLVCDGWAYYDRPKGAKRLRSFVGYFETDGAAIRAWLDLLGVRR